MCIQGPRLTDTFTASSPTLKRRSLCWSVEGDAGLCAADAAAELLGAAGGRPQGLLLPSLCRPLRVVCRQGVCAK